MYKRSNRYEQEQAETTVNRLRQPRASDLALPDIGYELTCRTSNENLMEKAREQKEAIHDDRRGLGDAGRQGAGPGGSSQISLIGKANVTDDSATGVLMNPEYSQRDRPPIPRDPRGKHRVRDRLS